MTMMTGPAAPMYPNQYPPKAPLTTWQTFDRIVTVLLLCGELLMGMAGLSLTPLFVMATDSCGSSNPCQTRYVFAGMAVAWVGIGAGLGGSMLMIAVKWNKSRALWVWPVLGAAVAVAAFVGGAALTSQVM